MLRVKVSHIQIRLPCLLALPLASAADKTHILAVIVVTNSRQFFEIVVAVTDWQGCKRDVARQDRDETEMFKNTSRDVRDRDVPVTIPRR